MDLLILMNKYTLKKIPIKVIMHQSVQRQLLFYLNLLRSRPILSTTLFPQCTNHS